MFGPQMAALQEWVDANRPDLKARLSGLRLSECRLVLNEETGLEIHASDDIEAGARQYLEAFKTNSSKAKNDL